MTATTILIADDQEIIRTGLHHMIRKYTESASIKIIEAGTLEESKDRIITHQPRLILLNYQLSGTTGELLLAWLAASGFNIPTIILFNYADVPFVDKMIAANAKGCILKDITADELNTAIQIVTGGEVYFSMRLKHMMKMEVPEATLKELHLTKREAEIVQLIVKKRSSREISNQLFLSQRTVETHRRNILRKFNVSSAGALVKALGLNA